MTFMQETIRDVCRINNQLHGHGSGILSGSTNVGGHCVLNKTGEQGDGIRHHIARVLYSIRAFFLLGAML